MKIDGLVLMTNFPIEIVSFSGEIRSFFGVASDFFDDGYGDGWPTG